MRLPKAHHVDQHLVHGIGTIGSLQHTGHLADITCQLPAAAEEPWLPCSVWGQFPSRLLKDTPPWSKCAVSAGAAPAGPRRGLLPWRLMDLQRKSGAPGERKGGRSWRGYAQESSPHP